MPSILPLYSDPMKPQPKLDKRERITQILTSALTLSTEHGYQNVTRDQIAERAGVSSSLVPHYMGTMTELRRKIMREAVRTGCLAVIAQGLALRDRVALKAPEELRAAAVASLA